MAERRMVMKLEKERFLYDVIIIGAGITGAATAFALTYLAGLKRVLILEKNQDVALVNSHTMANAQTLHGGDTETNFILEKALVMRDAEFLMAAFLEKHGAGAFRKIFKMALGVGRKEAEVIRNRFTLLKKFYPNLRLLGRKEIGELVPEIINGRDITEPVAALFRYPGYAVDYHKLARCFIDKALESGRVELALNIKTKAVLWKSDHYEVHTNRGTYRALAIAVAAGPYSLLFAHELGYAREYTVLPVAGSFYRIHGLTLLGKVYTVQDPDFPFAAPHMDPDVQNPNDVRFGPTAKILPLFERHHWLTVWDFMRSGILGFAGLRALGRILGSRKTFKFAWINVIYDIPAIGKWFFLRRGGRKIIPALKYADLEFLKGAGGIRPQLVNLKTGKLEVGTGKILGRNIVFDITPSPGASDSLRNAIINVRHIAGFLGNGYSFDEERFIDEFPETAPFFSKKEACDDGTTG